MKSRNIYCCFLSIALMIICCSCKKEDEEMKYSFAVSDNLNSGAGSSKITNIADSFSEEEPVKIQGQLLTLFGEPLRVSQNLECAYEYVIIATDDSGKQTVLTVYSGPTGPAIGGDTGIQGIDKIAAELKNYIKKADTTDFEYEGYYIDGPTKIRYKIDNGKISCSEIEIEGDELEKAIKICYPNISLN